MNPECVECDEEYNPRRFDLGYRTCLECGDAHAEAEILRKSTCIAPAYNKGAYMYVSSSSMARDAGR
jgi:hypothetical protein